MFTGGFPLLGAKQFGFVVFESTLIMPPGSVVLECCLNAFTMIHFGEIYSLGQTSDLAEGEAIVCKSMVLVSRANVATL